MINPKPSKFDTREQRKAYGCQLILWKTWTPEQRITKHAEHSHLMVNFLTKSVEMNSFNLTFSNNSFK